MNNDIRPVSRVTVLILLLLGGCALSIALAAQVFSLASARPIIATADRATPTLVESLQVEVEGNLGEVYQFSGELSSVGDNPVTHDQYFHVTGLSPGSPTRSSRRLFLIIKCKGEGIEHFHWEVTKRPGEGAAHECGEYQTIFATVDASDFGIRITIPPGTSVAMTYTIQVNVHAPY